MDFVPPAKQKELRSALERIKSKILIIHGPSGSSKTYTTERVASSMGLSIEYMEDIELYRNSLLTKNRICMIDMDDNGVFLKYKNRLRGMRNLIIETRTLPFIGRSLPNSITISFNKVTNARLKKFYGMDDREIGLIDGNLHAVGFCRYSMQNEVISIYHQLGKIFYSKIESIEEIARKAEIYGIGRFIGYLGENCVFFMEISDISRLLDFFSLCDLRIDGFFECAIGALVAAEKSKPSGFFSFKSFKGFSKEHVCGAICRNR